MAYRATPLACGYSPAELLMGHAIRMTVPMSWQLLKPTVPDLANFDSRHKARPLIPLNQGDKVWLPNEKLSATVQASVGMRCYELSTNSGNIIRRKRCQLRKLPESEEQSNDIVNDESSSVTADVTPHIAKLLPVTTSSGRVVKLPQRFRDELWDWTLTCKGDVVLVYACMYY